MNKVLRTIRNLETLLDYVKNFSLTAQFNIKFLMQLPSSVFNTKQKHFIIQIEDSFETNFLYCNIYYSEFT